MRPPILLFINVCHYLIVLKTKQKGVHFNYKPSVRPLNNLLVRHLIYTGVMPLCARFHILQDSPASLHTTSPVSLPVLTFLSGERPGW